MLSFAESGVIIKYILPKDTYILPIYCSMCSEYNEAEIVFKPDMKYMCVSEIYDDILYKIQDETRTHIYYSFNLAGYPSNVLFTTYNIKCIDVVVLN